VTTPLKLFFDECCSKRLARKIVEIYIECYPGLQTKHLFDFFNKGGVQDEDWLPLLETQKDWIVLTADRGKDPKKQKLPVICARLGITHIAMTPAVASSGYKAQKQALLSLWPQIMGLGSLPKGTKISLGYKMIENGLTKVPCLSVQQTPLAIWCHNHGIKIPN
jgi:PIN like domain